MKACCVLATGCRHTGVLCCALPVYHTCQHKQGDTNHVMLLFSNANQ
jgi:hypothetical protein